MNKKTIIYYTSNHEDPVFEQKIIDDLLSKTGNMPIISVSQKPMDLGQNICVGDIGFSYLSEYKQILAGAKMATTEYIIAAESDYLYPLEYFQFEPADENIYRYGNIWIMGLLDNYGFYRKTSTSEGAQIVKRDYFINILGKYVNNPNPLHSPYHKQTRSLFHGDNPAISIKTGNGVSLRTGVRGDSVTMNLPYWGDINKLRNKFL